MTMIREQARIVSISAGQMRLAPVASACGGCSHSGGCGMAKLAELLPADANALEMPAVDGQRVGDVIELALHDGALLLASLLAYGPALIGLIAGAALSSSAPAAMQAFAAMSGMAMGLGCSRLIGRRHFRRWRPLVVTGANPGCPPKPGVIND